MEVFQANIVKCPHCAHQFEHNMVNGLELVDVVARIDARKRMYCRLTLDDLEKMDQNTPFASKKKIILDHFNDFNRDIQTILGFGLDVEG